LKEIICRKYYDSYLILRKHQQKVAECLWKLTDIMIHPKALADSGLEDLEGTRRSTKKIWRRGFGSDTRWIFMPKWNAISKRIKQLHRIGRIQKKGNWLSRDLTERPIERRKTILLNRYKRKRFLHRIVTGDKRWIHYTMSQKKFFSVFL